ncbi:hypothetical protein [Desulfuromonas thiophila]|uniref:Uncharacterized protein n=1 Tax=Desulfuromonas thiophila TaxID=57664 RepID=A0A1G7DQ15_9BACT|nr:hypothetical protein [Desulfuromonas thiophila]SDE53509.1 hypothetical protein SAMN05661003_1153 [Desulfuromonas thiophila]
MSGFYLLVLIGLWVFVGWVIYRLWRRWQPADLRRKILHVTIGLLLFSIWFGGAFWEVAGKKMYWDAQVRKLCAIDGGVKVYETVELTPDLLDWAGRIFIPSKDKATAADLYFYEKERQYLRRKNPTLIRTHTVIIRRSDNKVLGELIRYGRGGGDLPGPWHPSSFSCPDPVKGSNFENSIFLKGVKK